jgi:hypothetical protein
MVETVGKTGTKVKHGGLPLTLGLIVMAFLAVAAIISWQLVFVNQPGQSATPQIAISGGGSPSGPVGPAPTETPKIQPSKVDFEQLVKNLDTPEKIRDFMINYPFKYTGPHEKGYEPKQLLQFNGNGNYPDFLIFFAEALKSQGCQWNPRIFGFSIFSKNKERYLVDGFGVVTFYDVRDGNNYYFIPDPSLKFPIIPMGKETDPIPFEEARWGGEHDRSVTRMNDQFCNIKGE